ncbi:hypothetical protein J6590_075760 [Homalodisca vitripennis]|nr:hypothetical protein J6590_075760 [Homalodisca vitripennis]
MIDQTLILPNEFILGTDTRRYNAYSIPNLHRRVMYWDVLPQNLLDHVYCESPLMIGEY